MNSGKASLTCLSPETLQLSVKACVSLLVMAILYLLAYRVTSYITRSLLQQQLCRSKILEV